MCYSLFLVEKWTIYNLQQARSFQNFYFFVTARPVLRSSQSTQWKVQLTRSVSRVSCIFSSSFPANFKIVQCLLQDFLASDLFTESHEKKHFRMLLILELPWISIYMLYSLSTACKSKYCICISWGRPVGTRIRVPRRPVPVWNLPSWEFCTKLPSDSHFLCFQFFSKPVYSLSQLEF